MWSNEDFRESLHAASFRQITNNRSQQTVNNKKSTSCERDNQQPQNQLTPKLDGLDYDLLRKARESISQQTEPLKTAKKEKTQEQYLEREIQIDEEMKQSRENHLVVEKNETPPTRSLQKNFVAKHLIALSGSDSSRISKRTDNFLRGRTTYRLNAEFSDLDNNFLGIYTRNLEDCSDAAVSFI